MNRKIKALLVLNGIKQVTISRKLKVTPTVVSFVISGKRKSARISKAIAQELNMKVEELWPANNKKAA